MRLTLGTVLAGAAVSGLLALGTTSAGGGVVCPEKVSGTPGPDTILGTAADDRILGLDGDDTIKGLGGNDCLEGGAGADHLLGGDGADLLDGGTGSDRLEGERGADRLSGGGGADTLEGGAGRDRIKGASGNDTIQDGSGNDTITAGSGNDTIRAIADHYSHGESIDAGTNRIDAGPGRDTVNSANGRKDHVRCGSGRDHAIADRADKLHGCERRTFLISPLPDVSPASGGRTRTFRARFRSLQTTSRRTEFFSIAVKGPPGSACHELTSNSIGVTYHRDRVVRYKVEPFSGNGRKAKRWCRGRYRGSVSFARVVSAGCNIRPDAPPKKSCVEEVPIGHFSFRVR